MDETHKQRIDFLCSGGTTYKTGREAVEDLAGETFAKDSPFYGRADLQTSYDDDGGFFVQPIFLIRDPQTGELKQYIEDVAHPDRAPSLYSVEMAVRYPDGDTDSATVCYLRSKKQAEDYAKVMAESA